MAKKRTNVNSASAAPDAGNFVSEWFGHRIYPQIVSSSEAISDQQAERCPFLTSAIGDARTCIKAPAARGICTISSVSNGSRQDWLVCPYRALNDELISNAIQRLFQLPAGASPYVTPAATLARPQNREEITSRVSAGERVFIYFDKKTSGELSIPATERSPEFSFDVTIVELILQNHQPHIGRFGILEIQTMDFHGSYRDAVRNLREGLRMHPGDFGTTLQANQWWLSEGVEGPNIANVFKRTFYQMMFKFGLGQHERCAGCVLAIPRSVWDSWQKHLGSPQLTAESDGTFRLVAVDRKIPNPCPAWIYVFDPDAGSAMTPSPIKVIQAIGTDAHAISYWALEVAPGAALSNIGADMGFLAGLSRRLRGFWPELARTVVVDLPVSGKAARKRRNPRSENIPIETLEKASDYKGPTADAIGGEPPDED